MSYEKYILPLLVFLLLLPSLPMLLPICLPFGVGLVAALAAEPVVGQMKCRRSVASAIGVSGVLITSFAVITVLLTVLMRQIGQLSAFLPDVIDTIRAGSLLLREKLFALAQKTPPGIRDTLQAGIDRLLGSELLENTLSLLPQAATNLLGRLSQGLLTTVTAVMSAYLFSVRMPVLRKLFGRWKPGEKLRSFRRAVGHWLLAEVKLALVALVMLSAGFLLMRLPNAIYLAGLITLVDILPILGVGTVLIPWSMVCFLQGDVPKAVGLLSIFAAIWLVRSVLEPKLVGKELGLDPLLTLVAIYAGFQLAGIWGILLAPMAAIVVQQLGKQFPK